MREKDGLEDQLQGTVTAVVDIQEPNPSHRTLLMTVSEDASIPPTWKTGSSSIPPAMRHGPCNAEAWQPRKTPREQQTDRGYTRYNYKEQYAYIKENLETRN